MIPEFTEEGLLPPGIHWVEWNEIEARFNTSAQRRRLLDGFWRAITSLRSAGCRTVYLDGSFVTAKEVPNDFDGCWDPEGVDPEAVDPVLLDFSHSRLLQKTKFRGELFVASRVELGSGLTFLEFFQIDRSTGNRKGVIALDLAALPERRSVS